MKTLFRQDARKVADRETVRTKTKTRVIALQVDSQRDHVHFLFGNCEIARHEAGAVIANGDERVHRLDLCANEVQRLCAPRVAKPFEKQFLALQRAAYGTPERGFEWSSQADEQRIWKNHDIRQRLRAHPFEQLVKFFALASVLTAQHRDSQLTQMPRADANGAACSGLQ